MKPKCKQTPLDKMLIPPCRIGLKCKHCDDTIPRDAFCDDCKTFLMDQCSSCHDEVVHDRIRCHNINTHGGRKKRDSSRTYYKTRPCSVEPCRKGN
jgi:hypothetical protein